MNINAIYQLYKQQQQITTDSRNCPSGSIFIALKGEHFNGNEYAQQALDKGCAYAIVDEEAYATGERTILVENCLKTLQDLANYHRKQLPVKVIGITGTNGKTTTKELLATVLSKQCSVLYTEGNLNNHIGVPLTLLRLNQQHELAIIEMGASHPGDIKELARIADPDYGVITNVGKAHLEGFGSYQGVLNTKGELFDYLSSKKNSTVFVRYEDKELMELARAKELNVMAYGEDDSLYINGKLLDAAPFLRFTWKSGKNGDLHEVETKLVGGYNLHNALAAIALGKFFAVKPDKVDSALQAYTPNNNRSQLKQTERNQLIIDAYNANPTSMRAALENFCSIEADHKMLILGEMGELGDSSREEHQQIVDYIRECGFIHVVLIGEAFAAANHSFTTYPTTAVAMMALQANPPKGNCILLKGSHYVGLEKLIEVL